MKWMQIVGETKYHHAYKWPGKEVLKLNSLESTEAPIATQILR